MVIIKVFIFISIFIQSFNASAYNTKIAFQDSDKTINILRTISENSVIISFEECDSRQICKSISRDFILIDEDIENVEAYAQSAISPVTGSLIGAAIGLFVVRGLSAYFGGGVLPKLTTRGIILGYVLVGGVGAFAGGSLSQYEKKISMAEAKVVDLIFDEAIEFNNFELTKQNFKEYKSALQLAENALDIIKKSAD